MVKIRLTRMGRHKSPFYRIVVTDSRKRRDGDYIALVGNYEPFKGVTNINEDVALDWLNKGAQPTDTVRTLLSKNGTWAKFMADKNKKPAKKDKKESTAKKTSAKKTTKKA